MINVRQAGVSGKLLKKPVGSYSYFKRQEDGFRLVEVTVYVLKVQEEQKPWKEADERKKRWFPLSMAAKLVQEAALATMIKGLKHATVRKPPPKPKA